MTGFYRRYLELCNRIGKAPTVVAVELGLNKSACTAWKRGSVPKEATLVKMEEYFGESVLLDSEPEKIKTAPDEGSGEMEELLETLRRRPDMKMLFNVSKKASPDTVRATAQFLEGLIKGDSDS